MSVCVQLYNTGWNVFSIEILGGGICLLCEKSPSHLPFYRGKQVPEDDKETDEDLKKVCTCSQIPLTPVHMYCTHCARLPHSTATLPKWCHSKVPRLWSRCLCDKDQGVLFPSLQLCTRDGNLTCLLDFLRSSSRNMLQWLMWSTPMATPRCV